MKKQAMLSLALATVSLSSFAYTGSSVDSIWSEITSSSYSELPHNKISYRSLFNGFKSRIEQSANRTLSDKSDMLPHFTKLAHPNGTCLKGTWNITENNPYTGQFKKGTSATIIARASVAMSMTHVGHDRAFGFAGKIFPTLDQSEVVKTANFFLVDDLGGTKAKHYTGVGMTNEPKVSKTVAILKNLAYSIKLAVTFGKADSNPGMRQLYQISELGESGEAITPKWMKVQARSGQNINERDFRDELDLSKRDKNLIFDIFATSTESQGQKNWKRIGHIEITDSASSVACDHQLHFNHPKWKSDLVHK